jgi:hypothetical protein
MPQNFSKILDQVLAFSDPFFLPFHPNVLTFEEFIDLKQGWTGLTSLGLTSESPVPSLLHGLLHGTQLLLLLIQFALRFFEIFLRKLLKNFSMLHHFLKRVFKFFHEPLKR